MQDGVDWHATYYLDGVMPRRLAVICLLSVAALALPAEDSLAGPFRVGVKPLLTPGAPTLAGTSDCATAQIGSGWGTFDVGSWPSGCWRPYSASSPFNRPIPFGAPSAADSGRVVARLARWGDPSPLRAGIADKVADVQHPTYYSRGFDPPYTVHCLKPWGRCEVEGVRVRLPAGARPAVGVDGHLTVVDQASGREYDFWQERRRRPGGGWRDVSWGGSTAIAGDGTASDSTAAQFGNLAGVIRAQELERGRIDHALFMVVKCDSGHAVYPAQGRGAACRHPAGAPAEGARFQLTLSRAAIDRLRVPRWKRTILRAMAEYGMYVGDTGGSPWDLELESGSTYTSFGFQDPVVAFARRAGVARDPGGNYSFDLASGIDWRRHLRVVGAPARG